MPAVRCLYVVLLSMVSVCLSFRTRRSGLAGYDDPYGLTNALQAIDRERRRSSYPSELQQSLFDDDDTFFNPNSDPEINDDYLRTLNYLENDDDPQYYPGYGFDDLPLENYPSSYGSFDARDYGPIKRTAYHPHRVSPNLNQLRDIFGDSSIPRKRMAPPLVPELINEEINIRKAEEDTRQLAHQINNLISSEKVTQTQVVEQTDGNKPKVVTDVKIEKTGPDGKTKTLEEIFEGADTDSKFDGVSTEENAESDSKEASVESSPDATADANASQSKSKRASSEPCAQEAVYIGELLTEIARLKKKLSTLEVEQVLEDKENDLLADALVYSTLDQLGGGSDFVDDEYTDISKATETEELIQMLADEMDDESAEGMQKAGVKLDEYLEPSGTETDSLMDKRADELPDEQMQWYEGPVRASASGAEMTDRDGDDDAENIVVGETPIDVPYPDNSEDEEEAEQIEEEIEREAKEEEEEEDEEDAEKEAIETAVAAVENEIEDEKEEESKVEMLRGLLKGLSPNELQELMSELQGAQALNEPAGEKIVYTCPAVAELSENCAFADAVGIPIDAEARNLCVRHQLCYTCGVDLGMARSGCDAGYKRTVVAECGGDSRCLRSAARFLRLMSEYHDYPEYSISAMCSEPCLEDFITGQD